MFAAIDVGSFALELGIYEISDKTGIRNVEHIRHVIALGSDTFSEGKISYDLVDEMCRVLEKFAETNILVYFWLKFHSWPSIL